MIKLGGLWAPLCLTDVKITTLKYGIEVELQSNNLATLRPQHRILQIIYPIFPFRTMTQFFDPVLSCCCFCRELYHLCWKQLWSLHVPAEFQLLINQVSRSRITLHCRVGEAISCDSTRPQHDKDFLLGRRSSVVCVCEEKLFMDTVRLVMDGVFHRCWAHQVLTRPPRGIQSTTLATGTHVQPWLGTSLVHINK